MEFSTVDIQFIHILVIVYDIALAIFDGRRCQTSRYILGSDVQLERNHSDMPVQDKKNLSGGVISNVLNIDVL